MAKKVVKKMVLRPGTKTEALLNWLKKWAIKGRLVFTSEHAELVKKELELPSPEAVWNMLQSLERKGLIVRKKRNGVKGIQIALVKGGRAHKSGKATTIKVRKTKVRQVKKRGRPKKSNGSVTKTSLTVAELVTNLESDVEDLIRKVAGLESEINYKRHLLTELARESKRARSAD